MSAVTAIDPCDSGLFVLVKMDIIVGYLAEN